MGNKKQTEEWKLCYEGTFFGPILYVQVHRFMPSHKAQWLEDINYPDGNNIGIVMITVLGLNVLSGDVIECGQTFKKIWKIRNNGNLDWPHDTQVIKPY